jgi:hypothetical protein
VKKKAIDGGRDAGAWRINSRLRRVLDGAAALALAGVLAGAALIAALASALALAVVLALASMILGLLLVGEHVGGSGLHVGIAPLHGRGCLGGETTGDETAHGGAGEKGLGQFIGLHGVLVLIMVWFVDCRTRQGCLWTARGKMRRTRRGQIQI